MGHTSAIEMSVIKIKNSLNNRLLGINIIHYQTILRRINMYLVVIHNDGWEFNFHTFKYQLILRLD